MSTDTFLQNLALCLAHSVRYEMAQEFPLEHCSSFRNEGDPPAPTAQESTASVIGAEATNLPKLLKAYGDNVLPYEQSIQNASNVISPQQQELQARLYAQYAPILNAIGQHLNASNAQAQSQSDLDILRGTGQQVTAADLEAQKQADPEYYKQREALSTGLTNLLNSYGSDPTALSGGELSGVERSLNRDNLQQGNSGVGSSLGIIQNAQRYGAAADAKRQAYAGVLSGAGQLLQPLKSGIDAFQLTTGRPSIPAFGANQMTQAGQGSQLGNNVSGIGNNLLNNIGQFQTTAMGVNANRRSALDVGLGAANSISSTFGNVAGGVAGLCWVAREVYGPTSTSWKMFRQWLLNEAPKWLVKLYTKYGEKLAAWIADKPSLKWMIRKLMDKAITI